MGVMPSPLPAEKPDRRAAAASRWLRLGVAFVWLWTGLAVLHPHYRELGESFLAPLGLPPAVMYATCAAEVLLGLRVALGRAATWLTLLQVMLIVGFTGILSVTEPRLWLDAFGVLTKNLALLVMIGTAWLLEREGWSERAVRLFREGLALFWVVDGSLMVGVGVLGNPAELPGSVVWGFGAFEIALAVQVTITRGKVPAITRDSYLVFLLLVTVVASVASPLLWFHPFGPLTKNVAVAVAALVLMGGPWAVFGSPGDDGPRGTASRG
jgi:hypothetical protein